MPLPRENWQPVVLAAKVIGHISQGMYRTPASAIKELVSNAYDAGATYVKIHTGFPNFTEFSCEDNGGGITADDFTRLVNGGIGDSLKQTSDETSVGRNGRPVIGRLGVGLLSLAQICTRFQILSHHAATRTAFDASIRFPAYTRHEIDQFLKQAAGNEKKLIQTGQYMLKAVPYDEKHEGTRITTTYLRDTFKSVMTDVGSLANFKKNQLRSSYRSFAQYLEAISDQTLKSLHYASHYDRLMYGIALAAPIPYPENTKSGADIEPVILRVKEMQELQKRLKSYDFRVELDNVELRRPIILPSTSDLTKPSSCIIPTTPERLPFTIKEGQYLSEAAEVNRYWLSVSGTDLKFQIITFAYNERVNGLTLAFSGYFFIQTKRLFPKEEQGVLVRLRHVAIGQYDVNVMTYPLAEGPRFSMLSGEIFVEEGLDDALKIDREGFNSLDPHYVRLQSYVHSLLHDIIFPEAWTEEKYRNLQRREQRVEEHFRRFSAKMKETTKGGLSKMEIATNAPGEAKQLVKVDRSEKKVTVYRNHPVTKSILRRKKFRGIAAQVIAAFEIANSSSSAEKRRELFYRLIGDIFDV